MISGLYLRILGTLLLKTSMGKCKYLVE